MTVQTGTAHHPISAAHSSASSRVYEEGIVAGLIGAGTIAIWFLLLDAIQGRPLYTPSVLGTALFARGEVLEGAARTQVSPEMALMFTWVHVLVFALIGGAAAYLLTLAERDPNYGFGVLLFFVVFEFGFVIAAMVFADEVLETLAWPAILVGNLLAAAGMATYFWRRHPNLTIFP